MVHNLKVGLRTFEKVILLQNKQSATYEAACIQLNELLEVFSYHYHLEDTKKLQAIYSKMAHFVAETLRSN